MIIVLFITAKTERSWLTQLLKCSLDFHELLQEGYPSYVDVYEKADDPLKWFKTMPLSYWWIFLPVLDFPELTI